MNKLKVSADFTLGLAGLIIVLCFLAALFTEIPYMGVIIILALFLCIFSWICLIVLLMKDEGIE